jgi:hypothetical protein
MAAVFIEKENILNLTSDIVCSQISKTPIAINEIGVLIQSVFDSLVSLSSHEEVVSFTDCMGDEGEQEDFASSYMANEDDEEDIKEAA